MSGEPGATPTAAYSFFNQSGLSSGGIIFFFRRPRPGPCGRPATIHAIAPIPGTKIIITNQAHLGKLRIELSGVLEQSMIEKIINAVTTIAAIKASRSMALFYRAARREARERARL